MNNQSKLFPAYLWIGKPDFLKNYTKDFLKQVYCLKKQQDIFCNNCPECTKINLEQHHFVRWICPEGQYTLNHLEVIFDTIIFEREENEHFFFIIQKAELLTSICANSLLKSLEEPPARYHFILLATRQEGILPTISSRCIVQKIESLEKQDESILISFLTNKILHVRFSDFAKEFERSKISEHEILDFIDNLYIYWSEYLKQALISENQKEIEISQNIINHLDWSRKYSPMPGSSKIFLKNLYLQLINISKI